MRKSVFQSLEDWKAALMTLPDSSYFELMRSIFGHIKTPFNKQRLMEDLAAFLSRRDIQETIAAYIDAADHRVIAAVAVLGHPAPGELESFFEGEYSYAELHSLLLNLEERLILYRFQDGPVRCLALNPVLEPVLLPFIEDKEPLFPSAQVPLRSGPSAKKGAALNDGLIAALVSFILDHGDLFKSEGGFKKKVLDEGRRIFRGMDIEAVVSALAAAGLLRSGEEGGLIDEEKLASFGVLSGRERLIYLAAGLWMHYRKEEGSAYFRRGRIQSLALLICRLLDSLDSGRMYPEKTLNRIVSILLREQSARPPGGHGSAAVPEENAAGGQGSSASLAAALKTAGLLENTEQGFWKLPENRADKPASEGEASAASIAMDSPFSFVVYPEISFSSALALAAFTSVREASLLIRFEISRESAVRGFDRGLKSSGMIDLLRRLSGKDCDQQLAWTLKDWESRYMEVSLSQGIVLSLAEERRYLAEAEPVASLIERVLAPGVFLLSASAEPEAVQALRKAGVDIIAFPSPPRKIPKSEGEQSRGPYPSLSAPSRLRRRGFQTLGSGLSFSYGPASADRSGEGEKQKEAFRNTLLKLKLPKDQTDELSARLERRLILSESQLAAESVRYEKLEARGLDYVGKHTIAKQALSSGLLLELTWPEGRIMGMPEALEKEDGNTILVINPIPQGEKVRIPLGKISLLRRIKQSIFGE